MKMIPPEQLAGYGPIFAAIEQRPLGLSYAIRACFAASAAPAKLVEMARRVAQSGQPEATSAGSPAKLWFTPVEIRDRLKDMGFPFEDYKANPLASIHTTRWRMVPGEMEVKILKGGQKVYRLRSAGDWEQALAEARDCNCTGHRAVRGKTGEEKTETPATPGRSFGLIGWKRMTLRFHSERVNQVQMLGCVWAEPV